MSGDDADRPVFGPADDGFHAHVLGEDWWATETAWFSFHHPGRKLGGWLYTMVRPNIGTVAGGAWVWDDSAALPWEVPYSANYTCLPLPADADLRDTTLPTGVSVRVLEPGQRYALGYDDPGRLRVDLEFAGVMAPEPLTTGASTFGRASHFDQIGRVSGHIELYGEHIGIDCLAVRDRTWGRRREDRPRKAAYVTAVAGPDDGFLAVTRERDGVDGVTYGFLRRDGLVVPLASGTRRVERDPEHGWITRIDVEVTDQQGRAATLTGRPVSRIVINRHTFIDINSLVRWELDGVEAWGEDQDMWPVHEWSEARRSAAAEGGR